MDVLSLSINKILKISVTICSKTNKLLFISEYISKIKIDTYGNKYLREKWFVSTMKSWPWFRGQPLPSGPPQVEPCPLTSLQEWSTTPLVCMSISSWEGERTWHLAGVCRMQHRMPARKITVSRRQRMEEFLIYKYTVQFTGFINAPLCVCT